jgi:ABC-type multidrug transport system ATPase subunit
MSVPVLGSYTLTRSMSGGNQQKVIVAREIERKGDLLLAVQPTRGLDVGAIENIHKEIVKVRDSGKAVLLVSLEIDEIFDLADTIYTIYEGHITGKFSPKETTFKEIGLYETGAKCQPEYLTPELEQEMPKPRRHNNMDSNQPSVNDNLNKPLTILNEDQGRKGLSHSEYINQPCSDF